jgi:hypothetical protein
VEDEMPILENCSIKFYTNGACKGFDSRINVTVRDCNDVVAALVSDELGPFEQYSEKGPFEMTIRNASEKVGVRRGSLSIGFEPEGAALWRFNFFIFLSFSDGTRMGCGKAGMELNENVKELTYRFDEISM